MEKCSILKCLLEINLQKMVFFHVVRWLVTVDERIGGVIFWRYGLAILLVPKTRRRKTCYGQIEKMPIYFITALFMLISLILKEKEIEIIRI